MVFERIGPKWPNDIPKLWELPVTDIVKKFRLADLALMVNLQSIHVKIGVFHVCYKKKMEQFMNWLHMEGVDFSKVDISEWPEFWDGHYCNRAYFPGYEQNWE